MSFQSRAEEVGRQVLYMVELELDWCANVYGQAPCTANGAVSCYQTRASCQDAPNWNPTTRSYRFLPLGRHVDLHEDFIGAIPCIASEPAFASSEAEPGGLGRRASVSVQLVDMIAPDHIDTDPYIATRSSSASGTWWSRFLARHHYYAGRPLYVYEGYADEPLANWRRRAYLIEEIAGPTSEGRVTIIAKDPLKALDGDRALVPYASGTQLSSSMNPNTTTINLVDAAVFADGAYVLIDSEAVQLGTRSGNQFTGCTRGVLGTASTNHSNGAEVNEITYWQDVPVDQAVETLLLSAGIPAAYIPSAEWAAEIATFMPGRTITGAIRRPSSIRRLLNNEICPENNLSLFWDELAQLVRLRVGSAFQNVTTELNAEDHIIDGRVTIRDEPRRQVTACSLWYGQEAEGSYGTRPDKDQMAYFEYFIDADAESAAKYNRRRLREFDSRWFHAGDNSAVQLTVQQWVSRFATMPQLMEFEIDAKDIERVRLGDVIDVVCDQYVNLRGERKVFRGQVLREEPVIPGHRYRLSVLKYFPPSDGTVPAEYHITSDVSNFDLWVALGGPPGPITIDLYVDAGVTVSSSSASLPALTTGAGLDPSSVVNLIRQPGAIVIGAGGDGGEYPAGAAGRNGGTAVRFTCDGSITHDNGAESGYIGGGGGGGGVGGDNTFGITEDIGGGGGGAGVLAGQGGAGHDGGGAGSAGSQLAGGSGGSVPEGNAGAGGDLGQPGEDGSLLVEPGIFASVSGGLAGTAIDSGGNNVSLDTTNNVSGPIT